MRHRAAGSEIDSVQALNHCSDLTRTLNNVPPAAATRRLASHPNTPDGVYHPVRINNMMVNVVVIFVHVNDVCSTLHVA